MKKLLPMLLALLCACEPLPPLEPLPPSFHILSISPLEQSVSESKDVTVKLDVEPRFLVDFSTRTARMLETPELQLGTLKVPLPRYLGNGQFQGTVPAGLEIGPHAVRVSLGQGREAPFDEAYTVTEHFSFWIEHIDDQIQGQAFVVTINAEGTNAEHFTGWVDVTVYKDGSPFFSIPSAPFSGGVLRQEITIDAVGTTFNVRVTDNKGSSPATSNSFGVISKNRASHP